MVRNPVVADQFYPGSRAELRSMIKGMVDEKTAELSKTIGLLKQEITERKKVEEALRESEEIYPGTKFKIVNSFLDIEDALRSKYSSNARLSSCPSCGEPSSKGFCMFCKLCQSCKSSPLQRDTK
jgi:tRNA(Ile)-lysidine synthase TilS/MesJ